MTDTLLTLAQSYGSGSYSGGPGPEAAVGIMVFLVFMLVILAVALAISVFITYLLYAAAKRLPLEYQLMPAGQVWLILIPLFGMVWLFFVVTKLSDGYRNYFYAFGENIGDANRGVGLGWAICAAIGWVPYLGVLAAIPALVCMIIYLVKMSGLKNRIPDPNAVAFQPQQPAYDSAPPPPPQQNY